MKFTIFTGCYNSEQYINRVFTGILSQTYKDFEWIIIDDCSKDNTVAILEKFMAENPAIDIRLIVNQVNQGVSANRRTAIQLAKGDLFITWDHDDVPKSYQLEKFNQVWLQYANDSVANIFSMCEDQFGKLYGINFPATVTVGNYLDYYKTYFMRNRNGSQERHVCSRVSILKQYTTKSFPEDNRFPDGDTLWGIIALTYNSILLNEVVRVYYNDPGSVNMSNFTRSQKADKIYVTKLIWVNHFLKRMWRDPLLCFRYLFAVTFYGFLANKKTWEIIGGINFWFSKLIALIMILPSKFMISYMKMRGRGL